MKEKLTLKDFTLAILMIIVIISVVVVFGSAIAAIWAPTVFELEFYGKVALTSTFVGVFSLLAGSFINETT